MGTGVELGAHGLAADDVVAVARAGARVELGDEARAAMDASAAVVAGLVDAEEPVYGVAAGFGAPANVLVPDQRREERQRALVRWHAAGGGAPGGGEGGAV